MALNITIPEHAIQGLTGCRWNHESGTPGCHLGLHHLIMGRNSIATSAMREKVARQEEPVRESLPQTLTLHCGDTLLLNPLNLLHLLMAAQPNFNLTKNKKHCKHHADKETNVKINKVPRSFHPQLAALMYRRVRKKAWNSGEIRTQQLTTDTTCRNIFKALMIIFKIGQPTSCMVSK